jgi:hypothetical protein
MPNYVSITGRNILPKGLNKNAKPDRNKVKEYVLSDYLRLLKKLPQLKTTTKPLLFYPGCGSDILMPLLYVERMFPETKEFNFLFVDINDLFSFITTTLDEVGVSFQQKNNELIFYWDDILINLEFKQADVFHIDLPEFDIYFELFFRIMKQDGFEEKAFSKLKSNGILISDSGFQKFPFKTYYVPQELSPYKEMIIGIKK